MSLEVIQLQPRKENTWTRISHNLVLHAPSGVYYVRKKRRGKGELFKTTGVTTKKLAQTKADEMVAQWLGGFLAPSRDRRISEICDELEVILEKEFQNGDRRARTWEHDRTYMKVIREHFGNFTVTDIDEEMWKNWVSDHGKKLNRTLFDVAKYLSKVLTFAHSRNYIRRKPRIKNPDRAKKVDVIYENSDIETFIAHSDPVLRDLIILAAECGLRPHENLGLKWEWIEIDSDRVIITLPESFTKTKKARALEASYNASQLLRRRYLKRVGPYVFPSPKSPLKSIRKEFMGKLWREMLKRAGYPKGYRFHWLRHSFFTKALLDAKLPLAEVAQYGGNSPTILMNRYLKDDPRRTRNVAQAVNLNLDAE